VIIVAEPDQVDADLAGGQLPCPRCGGRQRPWAHPTIRRVRQLDGSTQAVRPRPSPLHDLPHHPRPATRQPAPNRAETAEVTGHRAPLAAG
jgi:hypothetical protein